MAIDRADWHYGGDFPADLPDENGGTHIGMYLAWIVNNHLEGDIHHADAAAEQELERLRRREITGRDFLFDACDEKFWESDLNAEGLAFTKHYYAPGGEDITPYLEDYFNVLADELPSLYHVADTWTNYDRLSPLIDERYQSWRAARTQAS